MQFVPIVFFWLACSFHPLYFIGLALLNNAHCSPFFYILFISTDILYNHQSFVFFLQHTGKTLKYYFEFSMIYQLQTYSYVYYIENLNSRLFFFFLLFNLFRMLLKSRHVVYLININIGLMNLIITLNQNSKSTLRLGFSALGRNRKREWSA